MKQIILTCLLATAAAPAFADWTQIAKMDESTIYIHFSTTGNLNAPTIMLAEKIADVILGRKPLPRVNAPYYRANGTPARR